jgi:hypothetical protein
MAVIHSDLKKIVDEWTEKNSEGIIKGLEIKSPTCLLNYERQLFSLVTQLGVLIITWILNTRLQDKEFQKYAQKKVIPLKSKKYKHMTDLKTPIRTLFGNSINPKLRYFIKKGRKGPKCKVGQRGKNGSGVFPALEILGIKFGTTPALAGVVARTVTDGPSMNDARVNLQRWGLSLDIKTISRISEAFAKMSLVVREDWLNDDDPCNTSLITENDSFNGKRILISADGGRIRIRVNKRGRIASNMKRHRYNTNWREPKLITIRVIDNNGKVIREENPILDGTIGGPDEIFKILRAHLLARNIKQASEIVCVGDGAPWIWDRMKRLINELEIDASRVHFVLDFFHAVEHLSAVADAKQGWKKRKRKKWLNECKNRLKKGDVNDILDELKGLAIGRYSKVIKREMNYFMENMDRMRYDVFKNKNLPIGSGAMESGIRQVVNMRLKSAGMFWKRENAEGFLHLRCYLKSGRWNIIENAIINYSPKTGRV